MKKMSSLRLFLSRALFGVFLIVGASNAHAQITVTEDQPLFFGKMVIIDFNTAVEITINTNGTFSDNGNVYFFDETPTRGEYTLEALANLGDVYNITVPSSVTIGGGTGGSFTLDNITVRPNMLRVNNVSGQDQFQLTGRLRSAGGGTPYSDGMYSDTFNITINF